MAYCMEATARNVQGNEDTVQLLLPKVYSQNMACRSDCRIANQFRFVANCWRGSPSAELPELKAWADLRCSPCSWESAGHPCKRSVERESDVFESPDRTQTTQAPHRSSTRSWTAM